MTSPSNFEYSDDSVVARVSVDVPATALTDITQLTQAMEGLAVQQDYAARASGTWLDYMNQIPQIMERVSQSYRETITQLERMSYIQNEMGGMGGNVSPAAASGPQGGGYSTAAPGGYVNPFAGQFFGMGVTPDLTGAQQQLGAMASSDPRMYANMMAARGMAVNPALLGMVGSTAAGYTGQGGVGGTGGGMGWGNAAPGSLSTQATQSTRDASAPPDPTQGGATTRSEPQQIPATPHEDAPPWQKTVTDTINGAQAVLNETNGSMGRGGNNLMGLAAAGLGAAGKFSEKFPNALGGFGGRLGGIAKGAGLMGAGAWGFNQMQNVGEKIQGYEQMGSVQGGGVAQGMQYEAQARMLALNPFITTEQARSAMQAALSAGFKGGEYDTVMDYMLHNFTDMGVQFKTSMGLAMAGIKSGESVEGATSMSEDLLQTMKQLSSEGGASFLSRQDQATELVTQLTSQGVSLESANRAALGFQEGYGDDMRLRESIGRIGGQTAASPQLMQLAANRLGVTGLLPGALQAGLSEAGYDADELTETAAAEIAGYVQGYPNRLNQIAAFQALMAEQGVQMDWNEAEAMYDKVTGSKKPSQQANENVARNAAEGPSSDRSFLGGAGQFIKNLAAPITKPLGAIDNVLKGDWGGAYSELTNWGDEIDPNRDAKDQANNFVSSGRSPSEPPTTPQAAQQAPVRTEGQVQGEVRITVDQSGRVSAPPTIQLSGQQRSANAGVGNAQHNNAPQSDPAHGHGATGWSR